MNDKNLKKFFDENGYVVIKSLINKKIIDEVLNDLEKCKRGNRRYFTQSTHSWVKFSNLTKVF